MENNPMKRLLAMVLTICMLVTMVPTGVFAADTDVSYVDEASYVDENPYGEDQDSNVEEDPYVDEEPYVDEDSYAEAQEPYGVAPMSLGTSTLAVDTTENTNVSPVAWNGDTLELYVGSQADSVDVAYESLNNIVKSKISVPKFGTWRVYEVETDKEIWNSLGQSSLANSPCTFKVGYTYQLRTYDYKRKLENTNSIVVSFFDLLTIENNVEDGQVWKVFRDELDDGNYTLTVADKAAEGYTSVEVKQGDNVVEPTVTGGNTYTIQMNGDTTVSVVYSSNTSIPIYKNSADPITFGGPDFVPAGGWVDVTVTPHEGYYISGVPKVVGTDSESGPGYNVIWTDGAATVKIVGPQSPGENEVITVSAEAKPVLLLKNPEEGPEGDRIINYYSGMTYNDIVAEILNWIQMEDTVNNNMSINIQFKTVLGEWKDLTVENIGSGINQFGFTDSRTVRVTYDSRNARYPSGYSQEFTVKLVDQRPTLTMNLNQNTTLYLGGVKSMNWENGTQKFENHPSSYDKSDVLQAMNVVVTKADGTPLKLDQSDLEVSISSNEYGLFTLDQITEPGTYYVTVTYKDDNYKDGQVSQTAKLTVADGTPEVEITLNDTTIQWKDRSTSLNQNVLMTQMGLEIMVTPKGEAAYWPESDGYTVSIAPQSEGAKVETTEDGTPEVKEAGTYLVTVTFEKEGYGETTASATLTVIDARAETRVKVQDKDVDYETYQDWTEAYWKTQLHDTIGTKVVEGEDTDIADIWNEISVYTVAEDGTEKELTQKPGAGTYKLLVKYAGDNTRKPSQADATLTIEKAPGTTEVTVGVTNANYSSTIGAVNNKISVPYGSYVTITFTADEGYYLPGTYFENGEVKDLAENGEITIKATNIEGENVTLSLAAVAKNAATITAAATKELEATDLSKIEELVANTNMIQLFGAEVSNVFAGDTTEITYEVNGRNGVTQVGTYNVVFSYAGDTHTKAATKTVSLTIRDARPTAKLVVNQGTINYVGTDIDEAMIINAVLDASSTPNTGITLKSTAGNKITKKANIGGYVLPCGSKLSWDNAVANYGGIAGEYKVTLSFADNDQYKATTVDACFTVTDGREEAVISANNATILITNTDDLKNVNSEKLLQWTNAVLEGSETKPQVSSRIYKETNGTEGLQKSLTDLISGMDTPVTKIDSEGIYYVTFTFSGNAQYKAAQDVTVTLDIRDVRPTPSVNLKEGVSIPCKDSSKPITKEQAFNEIFQNVTVPGGDTSSDVQILVPKEGAFSGNQISVKMTDMAGKEITQATASEDTYYLEVTFVETNLYKTASAKVAFSVTDGREAVTFATDKTEIPYDFANGLKADAVLAALGIQVKKQSGETMEAEIAITLCDSKKKPITNADFDFAVGSYYAYVEYAGDTTYAPKKEYIPFSVVDARLEPVLTLKQGQSVDYKNGGYTANELYALVFDSLAYEGESVAHTLGTDLTITMDKMNGVGTYTVTVSFEGNNEYKPVTDTVEIEVVKAPVSITVTGTVKNYSEIAATGYNVKNMITVEPEDCDVITFAAGLYLGDNASTDNGTLIHVDLPSIIDWDKFDEYVNSLPIGGETIQKAVAAIREELEKGYDDMTIQELSQKLTELLEALKAIEGIPGINLNTQSIDQLIKLLNQIQQIQGVGTIKVRLTMGRGINITDSGAYLVGAVSSDANYKTDFGLNYLLVLPNAQKAELAWNVEDENGIYTLDPIKNGTRDMGAHVESVQEGSVEEAQQHVVTFFLGLDSEGKPTIIHDQKELNFGVYTEIAYICNLGNTMYYAKPIARLVTVVADVVEVKFDDGNSKTVTFNGEPQAMPAKVYTRDGQLIEGAKVNYRYIGMESDVEVYNSTQAPTHVGVYTVTATYSNENKNQFGLAVGTLTITPAEASVTVTGKTEYYQDGTSYPVADMIEKTPDDATMTVVTAYIADMADFSENGFAAVEGNVNIDFPDRIDQLLKITPDTTYTVADFKQLVKTAVEAIRNAGLDSQGLDQILELVNALPEQATLTFKDHNSIAFSNVGVYLVAAAVTDSDYTFAMDQDLLIIAPKTTEVTLQWNVEDKNGIITMAALKTRDMGATAYDEDGEKAGEDVQAKVVTYYLGLDKDGNTVVTDNKDDLTYGAWTQVAYVKDFGADMHYAAPIMRAFVIAPQEADVNANVESNEVTYDGKPHSVKVTVDGKEVTENLTVKYNGSTTLPVDAGTYVVTAVYKETDENGNVTRYGSDVGTLVIKPADPDYKIEKTEVCPGKSYTIQTNKIPSMTEILVIDDGKGNVYIQLPAAWADKLPADWDKDVNVTYWVDALKAQLNKLPQEITDSDILVKLVEVLDQIQVKTITVNELPTAEGTYTVSGVVAGKNYLTDTAENVLVIGHKFDETWEADENNHWHECQRENCDAKKDEAAHKDENPKDHKCDTCEEPMGECVDTNKDHKCDYGCSKPFGTCEDSNKDHKCDYGCDKLFGTCEDSNKDHKCDYGCDKLFGTCEDSNKDHKCDYGCGKTFGTCEDSNKDHKCDYGCGKTFGTCEDTNKDHKCDYGCDKPFGTCQDSNKDHKCDYGCDKFFGTCQDNNNDHKCDYGCGKTLSDHKAKTENAKEATCTEAGYTGDEFCSICGEPMKTGQTIAALDHDWDQGTVTKAPTYSETGIKIYTCKRNSSHTREEVLKALCDKTRENCPIGPFHDAETNCWYHDGVHYCIENGLMIGFPDGTFRPGDAKDETSYATRAQVVTILWRLAGSPVVEQDLVFTDVDEGAWYMPALRWAVKNNVVEGYPENTFRPNDLVTRQAVAALFCRYFNGKMDAPVTGAVRNSGLRDYAELHPWAEGYMDWAYENGLFVGFEDNTLRPTEGTTRAQLATLLFRYLTR